MARYMEYGYDIQDGVAIIPEWETEIKEEAFKDCKELTGISIPESVTQIGCRVFSVCKSLTSITIPPSVTEIGNFAFSGCSSLASISIPESVTKIGDFAFSDCSSLTSITIPESLTEIGESAFSRCDCLTSVHISDIAAWCNIKFKGVLSRAYHLYFNGEEVKDLVIPPSVTKIGNFAFSACSSLTSITIPESVT